MNLSENAMAVLNKRYLSKNKEGNVIESPEQMFKRVANFIARADTIYDKNADINKTAKKFYEIMINQEFVPNSPTLMNAGKELGQLSACFVLPVEDSMEGIFDAIKNAALIHKSGGGTGFSFSRLRSKGSTVKSTGGVASGPVSFMKVFNSATEAVKQGGTRRGANMGILRIDHPDILEFIECKKDTSEITNFNISVGLTEEFMKAVENGDEYELVDPHTKKTTDTLNARAVFRRIVEMAWSTGEPGIIFLDRINKENPVYKLGEIESTNPCVTGDTYVLTEHGMMRIDEIYNKYKNGGLVIATDNRVPIAQYQIVNGNSIVEAIPNMEYNGVSYNRTVKVYNNGKKDVFKVTTKSGYEIKTTNDHRFLTPKGWKELNQIKIGEFVLIQSGAGVFSKNYELPFKINNILDNNKKIQKIELPYRWSKEFGQTLGWFISDSRVKDDIKDEFIFLGKDIGDKFFKDLGVNSLESDKKEVPYSIYKAPYEAVVGFLQGLFTLDGSIENNSKTNSSCIVLTSESEKLLKGIQRLLINLGIKSIILDSFITSNQKVIDEEKRLYKLEIFGESCNKFAKTIGFMSEEKQRILESIKFESFSKEKYYDEVVSIEYVGKEIVYDLTEPVTHSMICNGMVVHQCGEQPLLPFESCNLGSINLAKMVKKGQKDYKVDYDRLGEVVDISVHFLDNVIDMNRYPLKKIDEMTKKTRKIGLGVMGFADMLFLLGIPYNSQEAVDLADKLMSFIDKKSKEKSIRLAEKRGVFPAYDLSSYNKKGVKIRNATTTTIAPTGTISIIAGASSGVEPLFAISFIRNVMDDDKLLEVHPYFEKVAKERNFYSKELMERIAEEGSIAHIGEIPEDIRKVFVTAHDISPFWHIKMQAAFQKHVDNAVSKTVNFRSEATKEEVEEVYMLAYKLGCKGVTIYRDGSRQNQVLNIGKMEEEGKNIQGKIKPRMRPEITQGMTEKVRVGCGNLYITANYDENGICEVFTNVGRAGGCPSQSEATSRLISIALRSGIAVEEIIGQLKGIRCHSTLRQRAINKDIKVLSCPDAIGKALERAMNTYVEVENPAINDIAYEIEEEVQESDNNSNLDNSSNNLCPECGYKLGHEGGCVICMNCGYSKCG